MAQDRRHHYVPAFYLALFTETLTQDGDLWVFDGTQRSSWKSTPRGAGHARDFNRIEVPGVEPLAIEKEVFGAVEDLAAPVLKAWGGKATGTLTLGLPGFTSTFEELSAVVTFIAAQSVRVPRRREMIDQLNTDLTRRILDLKTETDETFARAQESNEHLRELTREEVRAFLDDPNFRVKIDTAGYFRSLLPTMTPITDLLGARKWGIIQAPSGGPYFICSDDPVVLIPSGETSHSFFGTGFGTPGATVCIPLSARHALWGIDLDVEREPVFNVGVVLGSARSVATVNRTIIAGSHRFLFAGSADFSWLRDDQQIGSFEDLRKTKESLLAR